MCKVIFVSNPTSVLRLCCVVVGVVTINLPLKLSNYTLFHHMMHKIGLVLVANNLSGEFLDEIS